MAKQLGLNPRNLIKNRPTKRQLWKTPVHLWVRELYDERFPRPEGEAQLDPRSRSGRNESKSGVGAANRPHDGRGGSRSSMSDGPPKPLVYWDFEMEIERSGEGWNEGEDPPF
ncbi:MAG TPA: hypothetical protein VK843_00895 [Planctomycetota bacterium]|nr:hypothetical protein [Planctomycetota bacterium]